MNYKNPSVKVIRGEDDLQGYRRVRRECVSIYNRSQKGRKEDAYCNVIDDPEMVFAFAVEGIKGGLCVERISGNDKLAIIVWGATDKKHRRKGVCSRLVAFAREYMQAIGVELVAVDVHVDDNHAVWMKNGFTLPSYLTNGVSKKPILLNREV